MAYILARLARVASTIEMIVASVVVSHHLRITEVSPCLYVRPSIAQLDGESNVIATGTMTASAIRLYVSYTARAAGKPNACRFCASIRCASTAKLMA